MNRNTPLFPLLFCSILLCAISCPTRSSAEPDSSKTIGELYDRIAADLKAKKPIVATVYVALCDNDSQGIIPVKNKKICMGDVPEKNLYWATSGGLKGHAKVRRWKKVVYETRPDDTLAVRAVWKKRMVPGGELRARGVRGAVEVYLVGLAYRGIKIRDAMADYLKAVNRDAGTDLLLPSGKRLTYGGESHVIGFIGHDYFMDEPDVPGLLAETRGDSAIAKGVFGLSCMSDDFFRPGIQRRNTHILALNVHFTFPSAFTVMGILRGIVAGKDHRGIHREAARAFAEGQKKSVGTMRRALSFGDKPLSPQE